MRTMPLHATIADGELTIRIGVESLAAAAKYSPNRRLCWFDEEKREYLSLEVTDPDVFAWEVVRALTAEEEDGTTALHLLLDNAMVRAIEDGAEGISEEPSVVRW